MNHNIHAPSFEISSDADSETSQAINELENLISITPMSMADAFLIHSLKKTKNCSDNSIPDIIVRAGVKSTLEDVETAYDVWDQYDNNRLYRYISFDDVTEDLYSEMPSSTLLINELRGTSDSRQISIIQEKIRGNRMAFFIGQVIVASQKKDETYIAC